MRIVGVKIEQDKKSPGAINCQAGFVNKAVESCYRGSKVGRRMVFIKKQTAHGKRAVRETGYSCRGLAAGLTLSQSADDWDLEPLAIDGFDQHNDPED